MTVYELIKNASKEELAFALISLDDVWYDEKTEQYKEEYCNNFCTDCYSTASSGEFISYLAAPDIYKKDYETHKEAFDKLLQKYIKFLDTEV